MNSGIIIVRKEKGFTSFDVVAKLRGILRMKKIGHTGTLDPDAEGVLPICIGNATKVVELLTDKDKTYRAGVLLGVTTDTQDMTGTVLEEKPVTCSEEEFLKALASFEGEQDQIPPMYSALKVDGKRLYDLAREGITVERKPRRITVHSITADSVELPEATITVNCSKGTYIRTICADLGEKLGCGGAMKSLMRLSSGPFTLEEAHTLGEIEEIVKAGDADTLIRPVDSLFEDLPKAVVTGEALRLLKNGNPLSAETMKQFMSSPGSRVRMYDDTNRFVALYAADAKGVRYKPEKMFL